MVLVGQNDSMNHTIAQQVRGLIPGEEYTFEGVFKKSGSFSYLDVMFGSDGKLLLKDETLDEYTKKLPPLPPAPGIWNLVFLL